MFSFRDPSHDADTSEDEFADELSEITESILAEVSCKPPPPAHMPGIAAAELASYLDGDSDVEDFEIDSALENDRKLPARRSLADSRSPNSVASFPGLRLFGERYATSITEPMDTFGAAYEDPEDAELEISRDVESVDDRFSGDVNELAERLEQAQLIQYVTSRKANSTREREEIEDKGAIRGESESPSAKRLRPNIG